MIHFLKYLTYNIYNIVFFTSVLKYFVVKALTFSHFLTLEEITRGKGMRCVTLRIHADYYLRVKDDRSRSIIIALYQRIHIDYLILREQIQHGGVIDNYIMLVRTIRILGVRGEYL